MNTRSYESIISDGSNSTAILERWMPKHKHNTLKLNYLDLHQPSDKLFCQHI